MPCHTKLVVSNRVDARLKGCGKLWMRLKTCWWRDVGVHGCGRPALLSQRMVVLELSRGTSFQCRDVMDVLVAGISGFCCCSLARWL